MRSRSGRTSKLTADQIQRETPQASTPSSSRPKAPSILKSSGKTCGFQAQKGALIRAGDPMRLTQVGTDVSKCPTQTAQALGYPWPSLLKSSAVWQLVFAADVEGYSRLMGADEVATLDALTARREILDGLIASHGGRIANTAGDSVLAEFGSAVDAVRCAMEAQGALAKANSTLPESRQINFRIGVHVGDVMVRAGDLFGDGVNIAARLQTLARAGGLCVSGVTYDQASPIYPRRRPKAAFHGARWSPHRTPYPMPRSQR